MSREVNTTMDKIVSSCETQSRRKRQLKKLRPLLLVVPFAAFFYLFQLAPMIWVVINSFLYDDSWSLGNYLEVFDSKFIIQGFTNSLWISFWSSIVGLAIAALMVSSLRHLNNRIRSAVIAFTNMSSNFAGVPLAFAFIIILGTNGAVTLLLKQTGIIDDFNLYGQWGLLTLYIYFQIPLGILLLYPAFDALKQDWYDAAALLGASPVRYWLNIGIPVLAPALLGTFIILFANAIGAYASVYALTTGNYNMKKNRKSLVGMKCTMSPTYCSPI